MDRTNAEANDGGLFTDGNPGLGVPATVVDARILNLIQEELVNAVEKAGLTLDDANDEQLAQAIGVIAENGTDTSQRGGQSVLDNQASALDITDLAFESTATKSARFMIDVYRRDDTQSANEMFDCVLIFDPENDAWSFTFEAFGEDTGMTLEASDTVNGAGDVTCQITYKSSSYGGANYSGKLRFGQVKKLPISL